MTFNETDQRAFVDFETAAWGRMAPHYDGIAGRMCGARAAYAYDRQPPEARA